MWVVSFDVGVERMGLDANTGGGRLSDSLYTSNVCFLGACGVAFWSKWASWGSKEGEKGRRGLLLILDIINVGEHWLGRMKCRCGDHVGSMGQKVWPGVPADMRDYVRQHGKAMPA